MEYEVSGESNNVDIYGLVSKGGKLRNQTPIFNDIKRVFFDDNNELDYGDFAVYTYIAMHIQHSEDGGKGKPNGKQGYCYKTKVAMQKELRMSKIKLNASIDRLIEYGFIETREKANRYGGKPLLEYRLSPKWERLLWRD